MDSEQDKYEGKKPQADHSKIAKNHSKKYVYIYIYIKSDQERFYC